MLPFFIEWPSRGPHPSLDAPAGCTLAELAVYSPAADSLQTLFSSVGIVVPVIGGPSERLTVALECPNGRVRFP